ncbi:hypothetical protein [Pontibacter burrus]|uniref:STAS/SEC14 domain-containing protein n=1 Tax=Pontibacter burrus TaxID=2704466 RepID=A0A6B3LR57_9BACT|nr:hypothetical protein [Pontibacter burrus]NEM96468.1 hypothetical protein [Pontibacter burrus]
MILFQNSLVKLDYDPATDIGVIEYPDLHDYLLPEIKHSIDLLVDAIRSYDVKRLVLDGTKTVATVDIEQDRAIATYMTAGLMRTRIQRLARIQSLNNLVDIRAQNNEKYVRETQVPPFPIQAFKSRGEAIDWLLERI